MMKIQFKIMAVLLVAGLFLLSACAGNNWNDNQKARSILKKLDSQKKTIDDYKSLEKDLTDIEELIQLSESEGDESMAGDINIVFRVLDKVIRLFGDEVGRSVLYKPFSHPYQASAGRIACGSDTAS